MRAYKKGDVIDAEIVIVSERVIRWDLPIPTQGGTMRFTTDFTTPDKWKGKGEYSRDGQTWMVIMETELNKLKTKILSSLPLSPQMLIRQFISGYKHFDLGNIRACWNATSSITFLVIKVMDFGIHVWLQKEPAIYPRQYRVVKFI
jgi:hypothetical protein